MRCEVLSDSTMHRDGANMLTAMVKAAPMPVIMHDRYVGDGDVLLTYGLGHPGRRPWFESHVARGKPAVGFDLGYWGTRGSPDRPMRLTINADHPQLWLTDQPPQRFDSTGIQLRDDFDPAGPIVLVGLGIKTNQILNQVPTAWERGAFYHIRKVYPVASVIYRPKREDSTSIPGTTKMVGMPIEDVLAGASLVVCKHSNVAVDACIAGIPVVCEDGAAAALYNNDLQHPVRPTREQRLRFLRNLAWWQWRPSEAKDCWKFILATIKSKAIQ